MRTVDIAQATGPLADYVQGASTDPMIVTVKGKPVAAVVSIENADWETVRLSTDPTFLALIKRSRARQKADGGISPGEMRRRLGV